MLFSHTQDITPTTVCKSKSETVAQEWQGEASRSPVQV